MEKPYHAVRVRACLCQACSFPEWSHNTSVGTVADCLHLILTVSTEWQLPQRCLLIPYSFCQIQLIATHSPLAISSVLQEKKHSLYTALALLMGNIQSGSDRAINNPSPSTQCFRSTEGRGVIWLSSNINNLWWNQILKGIRPSDKKRDWELTCKCITWWQMKRGVGRRCKADLNLSRNHCESWK